MKMHPDHHYGHKLLTFNSFPGTTCLILALSDMMLMWDFFQVLL